MIKITPQSSHTISIIPRSNDISSIVITNEQTNEETVINDVTVTVGSNHTELSFDFEAVEGVFSVFKVFSNAPILFSTLEERAEYYENLDCTLETLSESGYIVYYDKLFCTSQTDYSINKNNYKEQIEETTYKVFSE